MRESETRLGVTAQGLFDRLPSEIFRPLAAPNRERYWRLLVRLNDLCFGPDAPGGMEEGLLHGQVTAQIEDALTEEDGWREERESAATPLNIQANMVLSTLVESGWLKEERRGVRRLVRMGPTVQKFLEMLKRFGEEGPMFVAGKVQVIYTQLQAIAKNPKDQAHAFQEVSEQAQSLISMLNGTAARVREVMDQLRLSIDTPEFVEGFFAEYVANLFLKDYQSLRTDNHPLRFRHDIVLIARSLRDVSESREALLVWYRSNYPRKPGHEVEAIFERDVARLLRFDEVERYLDRLDDAVSTATRQALSFLHYRLRSQGKIDRLIDLSVAAVLESHEQNRPMGWILSDGRIQGSGLRYVPVPTEGNQSSSPEEANSVCDLVHEILATDTRWVDKDGTERRVGLNDILIIAPYNAQVFELKSRLPEARIGTVDKFQGQEAPIVLYSMTTSSWADAPRGMEFLYSLNRLNVATSRAKCLCILVASPTVFEAECRTPRQMQLANAFCRYLELASTL